MSRFSVGLIRKNRSVFNVQRSYNRFCKTKLRATSYFLRPQTTQQIVDSTTTSTTSTNKDQSLSIFTISFYIAQQQ